MAISFCGGEENTISHLHRSSIGEARVGVQGTKTPAVRGRPGHSFHSRSNAAFKILDPPELLHNRQAKLSIKHLRYEKAEIDLIGAMMRQQKKKVDLSTIEPILCLIVGQLACQSH